MSKNLSITSGLAGCAILLVACSGAAGTKPTSSATDERPAANAAADTAAGQADEAVIARGKQALRETGISGDARLLASEPAQWTDSSLGCRRPGESYLQVITTGYVLYFSVDGERHEVHVAAEAATVCSPALGGAPKRAPPAVRARDLEALIERARADLAGKLGRNAGEVTLKNAVPFTWTDGTFACGGETAADPRAPVFGYKFLLRSGDQDYVYHTDLSVVFPCPPIKTE